MGKEIFKDIKGFYGIYQISNLGRVKSLESQMIHSSKLKHVTLKEKILKNNLGNNGYMRVGLYKKGVQSKRMIHQLMAEAFLNHKVKGTKLVCDHIDNDKLNNKLENIQIISFRENISKDIRIGTSKYIGVSWNSSRKKWLSQIMINKKILFLGYFKNELEASKSYQFELLKAI